MSSKSLSLAALSIFAFILAAGLASAGATFNVTLLAPTISQGITSTTLNFQVTTDANHTLTFAASPAFTQGTITLPSNTTVNTTTTSFSATLSGISANFSGQITGTITVADASAPSTILDTLPVTITVTAPTPLEVTTECADATDHNLLKVKSVDFKNKGIQYASFKGENDEWFPFEEIEAEIEVENKGNYDASNIKVMWGIYDTQKGQWVIDLDEEDEVDLGEGDKETIAFTFRLDDDLDVDLDELENGNHYRFYVVAAGEVDDTSAPNDGAETCITYSETDSVVIEKNFVVLDNFNIPETVSCGQTVEVTANTWNIGSKDQKDVKVEVHDKDRDFISETFEVGDIDRADNTELSLSFDVPGDADEKTYTLIFDVIDEDGDVYQNGNDDDSSYTVPLEVSGGCIGTGDLTITATTVSGGREGQELVVRATVTNTGTTDKTYTVNAAGFESWASSFSVNPTSLTLAKGQSGNVEVALDVLDDSAGSQTFYLEMVSGTSVVKQPVTVAIEPSAGFLGITGNTIAGNPLVLGLGVLILVLIIVIIVIAVRRR